MLLALSPLLLQVTMSRFLTKAYKRCGDNDVEVEPTRESPVDKDSIVQGFLSRKDRPWFPAPPPPPPPPPPSGATSGDTTPDNSSTDGDTEPAAV
ncbi:hypothetical protein EDB80DRAFT_726474 [Ilyonectria destructans]|nr:hypothetical protein EDB80DRAFT_726474 [Ilyonectria destructans]